MQNNYAFVRSGPIYSVSIAPLSKPPPPQALYIANTPSSSTTIAAAEFAVTARKWASLQMDYPPIHSRYHGLGADEAVWIDFGRHDGGNGTATPIPDIFGKYWNSLSGGTGTIASNVIATNLVTASNNVSALSVTTTSAGWQNNGYLNGGLLVPNTNLLGEFGISNVTGDYYFVSGATAVGTMRVAGLDPARRYKFSMFACRTAADTRTTRYSVTDTNGLHTITLQTTGTGAGSGNLDLTVSEVNGLFCYLGILEITTADPAPFFVLQPQAVEVAPGTSTSMVAVAISPQPLTYRWYFNNTLIPGATSTNLPLLNVSNANVGSYFVVVSNSLGVGWHLEYNVGPNYSDRVQRAPEVTGPWTDLGTFVGPANGLGTYDDTNAPTSRAFYRVVVP